jgi:hypothetical protein
MVVKRKELEACSLEVRQRKELRADDFGQKPAKHGVASDVWQGKDLAYFSVYFTSKYTQLWRFVKRYFVPVLGMKRLGNR